MLALADCTVDLTRGAVIRGSDRATLTTRETELLQYLVTHNSRVVSREELLREVWGYADTVVSRACDNTVRRLREKIEADVADPAHLLTVHGTGYRFIPLGAEVEAAPEPPPPPRPLVHLDPVSIDVARRRVVRPDGEVDLTESEAHLLEALLRADGAVVDRQDLRRAAWGTRTGSSRLLDAGIARLRAKIELTPDTPRYLHTARGSGYRLGRPAPAAVEGDLLGRDSLLAQIVARSRTDRWVLLIGPGGIGKSRLAREVAAASDRPVVQVQLAADRTAMGAATTVARALELDLGGADPVVRVGQVLGRRPPTLLVLDNLEGLGADAAVLVTEWRRAAPSLHLLGTSRVRLGAEDEQVVEVGPLDPDAATALFLRRARAAAPLPVVDPDVVLTLVDRLDRMPLAIELAAARTRILGLGDLLERLNVDLLSTPLAVDPRVASVRRAVEASLDALPGPAIDALAQLSLFRAGFSVDDAEGLLGVDAIDHLQTLRDHSLLHRVADRTGALRFVTWTSVSEILDEHRDPRTLRRHCEWLGRLGDRERIGSFGRLGEERAALRQLADTDELVHATWLAIGLGDPALAARCCAGAVWGLQNVGPFGSAIPLVDAVLAMPIPGPDRAFLLLSRGDLCSRTARLAEASGDLTAAAALAEEHGDWRIARSALFTAYQERRYSGRKDEARERLVAAIRASERADDRPHTALLRAHLAELDGDDAEAIAQIAAARAAVGSNGSATVLVYALGKQAEIAWNEGRLAEAQACIEETLEVGGRFGMGINQVNPINVLLHVCSERGDVDGVDRCAADGIALATDLGIPMVEAGVRTGWAASLLWRGLPERAANELDRVDRLLVADDYVTLRAAAGQARAALLVLTGEPGRALGPGVRAMEAYRSGGMVDNAAAAQRWVALAMLALGRVSEARVHAERALADACPSPAHRVPALWIRARVARAEGDEGLAAELFEQARALAETSEVGRSATELAVVLAA